MNNRLYLINGSLFIVLGVICYLIGRGILIGIKNKKQKKVLWLKEVISFLFVIYLCIVVSVALFPIPVGFHSNMENVYRDINIIPLVSIIKDISQIGIAYGGDVQFMIGLIARNVGGNILLLMPLGFLGPIVWNKFKDFKGILKLGFIISISIELLQFMEPKAGGLGRITDIDDVICNVLGVILGYLIYKFIFRIANKFQIKVLQKYNPENPELYDYDNKVGL